MEFDLEVPLVEGDERRQLLNPIGIQVLELELEMVKEPPDEPMGGGSQPALVERRERDNEARRGRWNPRDSGNPPLLLVLRVGTELATVQRARRADELEKTNERKRWEDGASGGVPYLTLRGEGTGAWRRVLPGASSQSTGASYASPPPLPRSAHACRAGATVMVSAFTFAAGL